jgi:hypothetical protein
MPLIRQNYRRYSLQFEKVIQMALVQIFDGRQAKPIHFSRLMRQAPLPIPVESQFLAGLSPMYQTALF